MTIHAIPSPTPAAADAPEPGGTFAGSLLRELVFERVLTALDLAALTGFASELDRSIARVLDRDEAPDDASLLARTFIATAFGRLAGHYAAPHDPAAAPGATDGAAPARDASSEAAAHPPHGASEAFAAAFDPAAFDPAAFDPATFDPAGPADTLADQIARLELAIEQSR